MGLLIIFVIPVLLYSIVPTYYHKLTGTGFKKINTPDKFLCLTFDDGPDEKYTVKLLDLLKFYDVKATFFVVAKQAEKNSTIIDRIQADGHTIALHSLEHKNALVKGFSYTNKDFKESINIMENLGVPIKFFRPPWGHLNIFTLQNIKKHGLVLVLWNVIIGDWKASISSEEIARRLLAQTKNKNIICLHDGRGKNNAPLRTVAALEQVLPQWLSMGYKFLKVGDLYE